jgi:hypothetical protein
MMPMENMDGGPSVFDAAPKANMTRLANIHGESTTASPVRRPRRDEAPPLGHHRWCCAL